MRFFYEMVMFRIISSSVVFCGSAFIPYSLLAIPLRYNFSVPITERKAILMRSNARIHSLTTANRFPKLPGLCALLGVLCAAFLAAPLPTAAAPLVRLNEVMASDNSAFPDEDGDYGDWIELVNAGDQSASLDGWGLTDDAAAPFKWTFPAVSIAPGEHLVVWADDKDRRPPAKPSDPPVTVVAPGAVWKYRDDGRAPDAGWQSAAYDAAAWPSGAGMLGYGASQTTTLSYGSNANNKYPAAYFRHTFELPFARSGVGARGTLRLWADDGAIVYLNGTEILRVRMPAGAVTHQTYATTIVNNRGDWETFDVPLAALTDGANVLAVEVHQINATSSDLCFWAELAVRPTALHTNYKIGVGADTVSLFDATGALVDAAPPLNVMRDASYGRAAGDPYSAWRMFPLPTPGAANTTASYEGLLDPPAFSVPPGFYGGSVTVALSHPDPQVQIYYTLDGSAPTNAVTASCFLYSPAQPLTLADRSSLPDDFSLIRTNPPEMSNHTQYGWMPPAGPVPKVSVVRAAAFRSGWFSPRGAAGTWLIGGAPVSHTLRVLSLMADRADLFGDTRGLFVPGDIYNTLGWNGHSVGEPNANYFQRSDAWERPLMVQMFETDRTLAFTQLMGARNHGGWSRAAAQKTLRLYARGEYGDSRVEYPLFPEQADSGYKRFLLRNSGNDWSSTGLRDAVMQRLFRPFARAGTQDYEPAVVYINGEYWGIQNIREHYSRFLFERKYGVDPDNVDFLKAGVVGSETMEIEEGDDLAYRELLAYVKANDLSLPAHYAWVEQRMDIDSLIDHYVCEIYVCNTDWPGNNLGVWRVRAPYNPSAPYGHDGRWRWLTYDTDHGFGQSSSVNTDMMAQARRSSRGVCQPFFDRLLANADFRTRFLNRFADMVNTAFVPTRVNAIIDAAAARVEPEIPRHIARWGRMGNLSSWQSRISGMKTFANQRPAYAFANLVSEFGLSGTARLTVDIINGAGRVTVNTLTLGADTPGLANPAHPYPWSGTYFQGTPVTVTAAPDLGFTFSHWETAGGDVIDPTLVLSLTGDASVRAVFEPTMLPRVTINEFMADANKSGGVLHPTEGNAADWFELFNESPMTVNLSGFWLVDDQIKNACQIPAGVSLAPGACLLVWTGDFTPGVNADGSLNASFGLGKGGDEIALLTPDRGIELDRVAFGAQQTNVSQGRWANGADGALVSFTQPTPGLPNRAPTATGRLPLYPVQAIAVGDTLTLSFAPISTISAAVYTVLSGEPGAAIDGAGTFMWTPPVSLASGIYAFRIGLAGTVGSIPVTDETTLLVAVSNAGRFRIETPVTPLEGGNVTGAGVYDGAATVTLTAHPEAGWRFVQWSDGLTASTRSFPARRDATYTALFAYGLLAPDGAGGTLDNGTPLLYWPEVSGADGYVVRRASSATGPFTVIGTTSANVFRDTAPLVGVEASYTVAGLHGESEGPACAAFSAYGSGATRKFTGTVIGSLGSYQNIADRTRDRVFDGDIATFYDAAANGGWPGLDFGSIRQRRLTQLRYAPRAAFPDRMVSGQFQISSVSDGTDTFESPETLHTITSQPTINVYTPVTLGIDRNFRYLRYLPPSDGWGNIAELEIYGHDTVPTMPANLTADADVVSVTLAWNAVANAPGYLVWRSPAAGDTPEAIAYVTSPAFRETHLPAGATNFYRVAAVNGSGMSAQSESTSAALRPIPHFAAGGIAVQSNAVTLRLSGALDPHLEVVCSETLEIPVSQWQPLSGFTASDPDLITGAVTLSITTNAPRLFFAIRVVPE